jgi:hypothetical protein
VFIGIDLVESFPFTGEGAVPASAPAHSGNEEYHLGAFTAEGAAGGREGFHLSRVYLFQVRLNLSLKEDGDGDAIPVHGQLCGASNGPGKER